jgi:hypothetical protein
MEKVKMRLGEEYECMTVRSLLDQLTFDLANGKISDDSPVMIACEECTTVYTTQSCGSNTMMEWSWSADDYADDEVTTPIFQIGNT